MCINYLSCCGSKMPDKSHIRKRGFLLTSGSKVHSFMVGGSGFQEPETAGPIEYINQEAESDKYLCPEGFILFIQYTYSVYIYFYSGHGKVLSTIFVCFQTVSSYHLHNPSQTCSGICFLDDSKFHQVGNHDQPSQ